MEVYSLPLFFAQLFKNFSYLEYPALGRMPDPPANGYQPGRADVGELCCPCLFGSGSALDDAEEYGAAPGDAKGSGSTPDEAEEYAEA